MNFENLLYETQDGVCKITLNRPQVYNALSPALIQEITAAILHAAEDDAVRVVILTGRGEKAFSSGADLKAGMAEGMGSLGDSLRKTYNPMILAIRHIQKPVICRLNGLAAGAGCSLALACDVIIAQKEAYLCQIFVNIGLMPDAGSTFFLPRIVGMQKAFEICSTGRKVFMDEALALGLVNKVVDFGELDNAVNHLVAYYKNAPTKAIGAMKQVLNQSFFSNLEEMLELEAENQDKLGQTNDAAEGILAFLMKRKTDFKGK
jgi:2-(1,2-epoxy-1,2-dihydrophenyl)acetyl-CoA isomerase